MRATDCPPPPKRLHKRNGAGPLPLTGHVSRGRRPEDSVYVAGTLVELLDSMAAYEAHDLCDTRAYALWVRRVNELLADEHAARTSPRLTGRAA